MRSGLATLLLVIKLYNSWGEQVGINLDNYFHRTAVHDDMIRLEDGQYEHMCTFDAAWQSNALTIEAFVAEKSVRSPRQIFIFII